MQALYYNYTYLILGLYMPGITIMQGRYYNYACPVLGLWVPDIQNMAVGKQNMAYLKGIMGTRYMTYGMAICLNFA